MSQQILIVNQHAPYGSSQAYEALDLALSAATFDQKVNILFVGAGCYQTLKRQDGGLIDRKNLNKMLAALPIYGIETLLIDGQSLQSLSLSRDALMDNCQILSAEEIKDLYRQADQVFHF